MSAPTYERTAGRLVVRRRTRAALGRHPMATRTGATLLCLMLAAGAHWRPLTRTQRSALRRAIHATLAALPADVADDTPVPSPTLPGDVHPATRRSLITRGLADTDGRLTPLAIEVVQLADHDARPIRTATLIGGVL